MSVVAGIAFGIAVAAYILSHYDRRVKKVYVLAVAVVAALTALADFTSTQIPVGQECTVDAETGAQICVTKYANDPAALIFFVLSIILLIIVIIELSLEGMTSVWP